MKKETHGGRNALRGFFYQLLYSALSATSLDISDCSTINNEISAKFVFEGLNEHDIIVSYPNSTEYVEIKSRRGNEIYWRLDELILIFKKLFQQFDLLSKDYFTFATDGRLGNDSSSFYLVCRIIKHLKDLDKSNDTIIATLSREHFHFHSNATIWGLDGLDGGVDELFAKLNKIFAFPPNNNILFEALSRIKIIDNFSENSVEESIVNILKYYVPQETIKSVISQLIVYIFELSKNAPVSITRDSLFKAVHIPTIPILLPIVKKACLQFTLKHSTYGAELILHEAIRRPHFEKAFSDFMQDHDHNLFLLSGNSGVGKTTSCIKSAQTYANILPTIYVAASRFKSENPIEYISKGISLELGRSDILPLKTILSRLNDSVTIRTSNLLIIIDGIDSLSNDRFAEINSLLNEYFVGTNTKFLFSCKQEKLEGYEELLKSNKLYNTDKMKPSNERHIQSFILNDFDTHEFFSALLYYGHRVSRLDDVGNYNLYHRNPHLHRPLYLSIFSKVSKSQDGRYPPSLGVSIFLEIYFDNLLSHIAREYEDYPNSVIRELIWSIMVAVAKQMIDHIKRTSSDLLDSVAANYKYLGSEVYRIMTKLLNAGIIYEDKIYAKKINENIGFIPLLYSGEMKFFHDEIGEWVLAFNKAMEIANKDENEICEILLNNTLGRDYMLSFGILHRKHPLKYNNVFLKLLGQIKSATAAWNLMSVLHAPDRTLMKQIIQVLKQRRQDYPDILSQLQRLYSDRGIESNAMSLSAAAIKEFEASLEIIENMEDDFENRKTKASVLNNLSISYMNTNELEKAITLLKKAVELVPSWHSYMNLAEIEFSYKKNYKGALSLYEQAAMFEGQVSYGKILLTLNSKGACLFRLGNIEKACQIWMNILSQCEEANYLHNHAICHINNNIGDGMFRLGNYPQAIFHFLRVLSIDTCFEFDVTLKALIYLIVSYLKASEPNQAKMWLDRNRHLIDTDTLTETLKTYDILEFNSFFLNE